MAKVKRYDNDYTSVTTVLGILRKIGLEMWFKYNTAAFCKAESDKGKLVGTQIHKAIEEFINTGQAKIETAYTSEVTNALKGFASFRKDHPGIELKNSEIKMASEIHKCNGTLDCTAKEKGIDIILDWKSGNAKKEDKPKIYDEMRYQVSAYVNFYNEIMKTDVKKAAVLVLAKDKVAYTLYKMEEKEINDCFNEAFLPALKIHNFQKKKKEV